MWWLNVLKRRLCCLCAVSERSHVVGNNCVVDVRLLLFGAVVATVVVFRVIALQSSLWFMQSLIQLYGTSSLYWCFSPSRAVLAPMGAVIDMIVSTTVVVVFDVVTSFKSFFMVDSKVSNKLKRFRDFDRILTL